MHHQVIIIGTGPAGYTAAIYLARANMQPVIISGLQLGGQLTTTTEVENYPGFPTGIDGNQLMDNMRTHAEHMGAMLIYNTVIAVDTDEKPMKVVLDGGDIHTADSIIIATGASARWLGIEGEETYRNKGISACATCDGAFFKNKNLIVVGGGNTAVEEALYLTNHAKHIYLMHRGETLRAEAILQDRLWKNKSITFMKNTRLIAYKGDSTGLTGVRLEDTQTKEERDFAIDGVFVAIGHSPNSSLFQGQLDIDEWGYITIKQGSTRTSKVGVFACGDVQDKIYRQAITAAGTGCMAALDAQQYLMGLS